MATEFALSTRWNAYRHDDGESLLSEIVEQIGLNHVELGYDLTLNLVPGVQKLIDEGAVSVNSVHNYCPVPIGAPMGHPELFLLASQDKRNRESAIKHTTNTIEFAARVGAHVVVCHAGNVDMKRFTNKLINLAMDDKQYTPKYEKLKMRLLLTREKKVVRHLDHLSRSVEQLLPILEDAKVALAFENLPSWEAIPTETEMQMLAARFNSPWIRYWHDFGHAQIRHNLGLISHASWLQKLQSQVAGFHIHDVKAPAHDHIVPPHGNMDFTQFSDLIPHDAVKVFEPSPGVPADILREGVRFVKEAWETPSTSA